MYKKKVTNAAISIIGAPTVDVNDANVTFPLVTEIKTKVISKNSRTVTYLLMYLLIYSLSCIFPMT